MSTAAVSLYSKSKLQKNNFLAKEMFEDDRLVHVFKSKQLIKKPLKNIII